VGGERTIASPSGCRRFHATSASKKRATTQTQPWPPPLEAPFSWAAELAGARGFGLLAFGDRLPAPVAAAVAVAAAPVPVASTIAASGRAADASGDLDGDAACGDGGGGAAAALLSPAAAPAAAGFAAGHARGSYGATHAVLGFCW